MLSSIARLLVSRKHKAVMKMHAKVLVDWRCGKVREAYDEAEAMYTKALRLEPDNVVALRDYAGASPRVYPLLCLWEQPERPCAMQQLLHGCDETDQTMAGCD